MIRNNLIIKFFFFLICASPQLSYALDAPKPKARPEVRLAAFQDVFDQIKKQNWVMAKTLADDYDNKPLSSYKMFTFPFASILEFFWSIFNVSTIYFINKT